MNANVSTIPYQSFHFKQYVPQDKLETQREVLAKT